MSAALTMPGPVELDTAGIEAQKLAQRIGQAVADQHPGVQIAEDIHAFTKVLRLNIQHPAHSWELLVPTTNKAGEKSPTDLEREAKAIAMGHYAQRWKEVLARSIEGATATNVEGEIVFLSHAITTLVQYIVRVRGGKGKFIFIGNGGSASIASHMAEDFTKNGGARSVTFNDAALLSCYANDYGWEKAFARAVDHYGDAGDVLVAISSSGKSANILEAVAAAKAKAMSVITLSGFAPENPLRATGNLNLWVSAHQYGFVETAHAALLHMALDLANGWVGQA